MSCSLDVRLGTTILACHVEDFGMLKGDFPPLNVPQGEITMSTVASSPISESCYICFPTLIFLKYLIHLLDA